MPDSLQYKFRQLPFYKKLALAGGILTVIGAFLPWYQDIDKFKTGDMFLGITGPMYLAGLIVAISGAACALTAGVKLFKRSEPKLPLSELQIYIAASGLSILMLVLALSVYFHPKFGINLTEKNTGIGVIFSFIGTGLTIFGVIAGVKKKEVDFDTEGEIKPLIDIDDRVSGGVSGGVYSDIPDDNEPKINYIEEDEAVQKTIDL
ncbi:hypothetical protein COY05_01740 [Candidatus Peregrinibacteria bacterium CG_4_10_14_0_2_um_filter_38_24]|nr:MAG: hypothetical protein COY05_01740 [Candidatus Peregrinibacteria bacterium CG_4_10_14_0_2_um_filter_38_24]PJC39048.1 MAG: hypothetical protein CO044_01805 [Candidatus Peregrinibacteria bacterium CG_4_9_14_0_2_um_filter_38_9]